MGVLTVAKETTKLVDGIIELLASNWKHADIAKELECSIAYVKQVSASDEYRDRYFNACRRRIQDLVPLAVDTLRELMADKSQQGAVRVSAAKEVVAQAHLHELELPNDIKVTVSYE